MLWAVSPLRAVVFSRTHDKFEERIYRGYHKTNPIRETPAQGQSHSHDELVFKFVVGLPSDGSPQPCHDRARRPYTQARNIPAALRSAGYRSLRKGASPSRRGSLFTISFTGKEQTVETSGLEGEIFKYQWIRE